MSHTKNEMFVYLNYDPSVTISTVLKISGVLEMKVLKYLAKSVGESTLLCRYIFSAIIALRCA